LESVGDSVFDLDLDDEKEELIEAVRVFVVDLVRVLELLSVEVGVMVGDGVFEEVLVSVVVGVGELVPVAVSVAVVVFEIVVDGVPDTEGV